MFIVEPHSVWVALFLEIAKGVFAIFSILILAKCVSPIIL